MNENSIVIKYLREKGYNVRTQYYNEIAYWKDWYEGRDEKFHTYIDQNNDKKELYKLGMAKKVCEDWSSVIYTERDNLVCNKEVNNEFVNNIFQQLNFEENLPENIENAFWSGTVCSITRLKNVIVKNKKIIADSKSKIEIVNVTADKIIPLKIENGKIKDLAIVSESVIREKKQYYIEIHEFINNEYVIKNTYLDENGKEIDLPDGKS